MPRRLLLEYLEERTVLSLGLSPFNWSPQGPAPIGPPALASTGRITGVAVDKFNASNIYITAASGGVWNTTNGGRTWTPLSDNQVTLNMGAIALAPRNSLSDPITIYAATGEGNFNTDIVSLYGRGILKSTNGGANWTLLGQGPFNGTGISTILVHPANPNIVYVAVADRGVGGVWKSTDGGQNWTNMTRTQIGDGLSFTSLVLDPTNPQILYAAVGIPRGHARNGVYVTNNGGDQWTPVTNGLPSGIAVGRTTVALAPSAPQRLYVTMDGSGQAGSSYGNLFRILRRNDDATWSDLTNKPGMGNFDGGQGSYNVVLAVDPSNSNVVYATGSFLFLESRNGGESWSNINLITDDFRPHDDRHAAAFDRQGKLLVGTDGGLWRLDDPNPAAPRWGNLNGNLQITQFYHIALDPTTPDIAYGASQDNGVHKFQNSLAWNFELCCDGFNVAVSPTNHNRVYANMNGTFFRSDNGGTNFAVKAVPSGSRNDLYIVDPNNGDRVLMGGNSVFESTNAGDSWTARNGIGWPANATVDDVAVSKSSPNTLYVLATASGTPGTYVTTDDGQHWAHFNSPGNDNDFWGLQVDPLNSQLAYALNHSGGRVYRTTNGGQTWSNITGNLPRETAFSIAVNSKGPADSDKVLYVGNDIGVYATYNMGATWSRVSQGLPNAHVTHVEVNPGLNVLAAGTYGRGLWELQIGVNAQIQNGTLNIEGDDGPNIITIRRDTFTDPTRFLDVWEGNSVTPLSRLVGVFPFTFFNDIVVHGLDGNDTVNIETTLPGKPVAVHLGSGSTTVNVGSAGNVQDIQGHLFVEDLGGSTVLNVDDSADGSRRTPTLRTVANTGFINDLAPAEIQYVFISSVIVRGGTGVNTFTVSNTVSGIPTTLFSGSGSTNTVNVQGTTGPLTVFMPGTFSNVVNVGSATNTLDAIQGIVNVNGQGSTAVNLNDQGTAAAQGYDLLDGGSNAGVFFRNFAPGVVNYRSVASVALNGGGGGNTFTADYPSTSPTVTLNPGGGTTGRLTKNNTGLLILTGVNNYSGPTPINGGTLRVGNARAVTGNSAVTVAAGARFDLNNHNDLIGSLAGPAGASVALGLADLTTGLDNTSTTFSGVISGPGRFFKNGTGTFTLGGVNTYTGGTFIRAGGPLQLGVNFAVPAAGGVGFVEAGARFDLNDHNEIIGSLTGPAGTSVTLGTADLTTGVDNISTTFSGDSSTSKPTRRSTFWAFHRVGLLDNGLPGRAGLPFI